MNSLMLRCRKTSAFGRKGQALPETNLALARLTSAVEHDQELIVMKYGQFRVSRRSVTLAAVLVGMVSLAIGAHAALNKRSLDVAKALDVAETTGSIAVKPSRVALVIGNGHYPDANQPLKQSINDARALATVLRRDGFDVIMVEDADKDDMRRAVSRLESKIGPDTDGAAVLQRVRHSVRPRELHDPGRCADLEGSRRSARRALHRNRSRRR